MTEDATLLRRFVEDGSPEAFGELVRRHLDLVYAAALRHVGQAHHAEDIAQSVFTALARKAPTLQQHPALVSWLYTSTRYAAMKTLRTERRRLRREQEALRLEQILADAPEPDWDRLRPLLDDVLLALGERDREIVLLRYFGALPFAEVARRLRLGEGAARMRIERALEKMNRRLVRQGIRSTAGALSVALAGQAGMGAPFGLGATVTQAALTAGASGGSLGVFTTLFAMSKMKLGLAAAFLAAGAVPVLLELNAHQKLNAELASLLHDNARLSSGTRVPAVDSAPRDAGPDEFARAELQRLRSRLAVLKARPPGAVEAALKPATAWQYRGRLTPADAYETHLWAASVADIPTLADSFQLSPSARQLIATFFAHLSGPVQERHGGPDRYFARLWLDLVEQARNLPVAFQVLGEKPAMKGETEHQVLSAWVRSPSGEERMDGGRFVRGEGGWLLAPARPLSPSEWRALFAEVDPTTGVLRAGGGERFRRAMATAP